MPPTVNDVHSASYSKPLPEESDSTILEIHAAEASPVTSRVKRTPSPAGIVLPVKLKPITVEPPVETVKPASCAAPPLAPFKVTPSTLN